MCYFASSGHLSIKIKLIRSEWQSPTPKKWKFGGNMARELIKTSSFDGARQKRNRMMGYGWRPVTKIKYIDPYYICVMEIPNEHPHSEYGKYWWSS
jgi:hypothetical protein